MDFRSEKQLVLNLHEALIDTGSDKLGQEMARFTRQDYIWRGFHPFNELHGPTDVANTFWTPLKKSLNRLQRRMDVFFAGQNYCVDDGAVWVCSMGHLMGLFDQPWLGIKPTRKMVFLRYCEFHKVIDRKISETAMFFDIPHLMMQAGLNPFGQQTAAHLVQPGPMTHDGLLYSAHDPAEGQKTMQAIEAMITDLGQWQSGLPLTEELSRSWNDDMIWWGPAGIGSTYTIDRYAEQHSGPFRAGFSDRSNTNHLCRIAEGHYGGFFGWPNFTAVPTGGFMGMPATGKAGEFRVIDIYRRSGDKLTENWVFIDLLHFWKQQGVDLLARTTGT